MSAVLILFLLFLMVPRISDQKLKTSENVPLQKTLDKNAWEFEVLYPETTALSGQQRIETLEKMGLYGLPYGTCGFGATNNHTKSATLR